MSENSDSNKLVYANKISKEESNELENENAEKHVNILNEFYEENKDIDENTNISVDFIKNISSAKNSKIRRI